MTTNTERFARDSQGSTRWRYPLTIDVNTESSRDGHVNVNHLQVGTTHALTDEATIGPGTKAVFWEWESSDPSGHSKVVFVQGGISIQMEGSSDPMSATTTLFLF